MLAETVYLLKFAGMLDVDIAVFCVQLLKAPGTNVASAVFWEIVKRIKRTLKKTKGESRNFAFFILGLGWMWWGMGMKIRS